ncbi:lysophospholipid acyltransferase 7 isoform X1 [Schistocerca gregaria]|uniref:lysophospholipid acyltransferase 7 isoform X1 n=1 Tax=Schistocerca gregaria TaxID=7010 RepID=UPI00211DD923|nr:lysophospholipid acyltransferase 7 isoform X1 [Schistocerca gregaria]
MEWDDVLYVSFLLFSILFGHVIRTIRSRDKKKYIATFVGLLVVYAVSGVHILHPLLSTLVSTMIITRGNHRSSHLINLAFLFGYLLFFRNTIYFGIPYPPPHANLVQMILTLKLSGLAFEKNDSESKNVSEKSSDKLELQQQEEINYDGLEIFHYAFCYVGVLTGPYYRYRTYRDWLQCSFAEFAPCIQATIQKLKYVPLYAGLFLLASYLYPIQYMESEEFYKERSIFYRIWYLTPTFFIFRMRLYTGMVLSECVCTMAGFGAYPASAESRRGHGPTKAYIDVCVNSGNGKRESYDFETIHNVDPFLSDFVPTTRAAMKHWNSCVQYWLAVYVYKRLPFKKLRTLITMAVSAYWHGVHAGYYLCMCTVPFYLPVEDLYVRLFRKDAKGNEAKVWDIILWFFKMQEFGYMTTAFLLLRLDKTLHYWKSIYFIGHLIAAVLYLVGISIEYCVHKKKKEH